jgi:hypothetical protein
MDEKELRIEQWATGKYDSKNRIRGWKQNRNERGRSVIGKRDLHKTDRSDMKVFINYNMDDTIDEYIPVTITKIKTYRHWLSRH